MGFRVVSINAQAFFRRKPLGELAALVASTEPDVLLVQECRPSGAKLLFESAGLVGVHSHAVDPPLSLPPPDGCAVGVRPGSFDLETSWRIPPEAFDPVAVAKALSDPGPPAFDVMPERLAQRFSARTLISRITGSGGTFLAASFHATPGTGTVGGQMVGEYKPIFHGAVALHLAHQSEPFVFGIDANEPKADSLTKIEFHWSEGRPGQAKFAALLGLHPRHRGRDLLRQSLAGQTAPTGEILLCTHTIRGGAERHFDHLWATPELRLVSFTCRYNEAVEAGTDHALLVADLEI